MAYFHCLIGGGSSGGGYELTVTCDADFAGTTITATDGVTTLTQTCPSASPYEVVFEIPNGGDWTISGIISGQTYSTAIDIPDSLELHSVPEGSTVLPTDDIQTWLKCAGITDKSYTTLNEVLADSTTLLALISDNNAVDYLVRSTTWASGITADSTAMTDIGANNYCANTLLSDSTWAEAICDSTYFESVLNVKVPVMTSNTAPYGIATTNADVTEGKNAYYCFDNNINTYAAINSGSLWVCYQFTAPVRINKVGFITVDRCNSFEIQADNGDDNFVTIYDGVAENKSGYQYFEFNNDESYLRWRMLIKSTYQYNATIWELQFYGRADV